MQKKSSFYLNGKNASNLSRWKRWKEVNLPNVYAVDNVLSDQNKQINQKRTHPRSDLIASLKQLSSIFLFSPFIRCISKIHDVVKWITDNDALRETRPEKREKRPVRPKVIWTLFQLMHPQCHAFGWLQCRDNEIIELLPLMNRRALNHIHIYSWWHCRCSRFAVFTYTSLKISLEEWMFESGSDLHSIQTRSFD